MKRDWLKGRRALLGFWLGLAAALAMGANQGRFSWLWLPVGFAGGVLAGLIDRGEQ